MDDVGLERLAVLEPWSSAAFLVGGGAWLGFAVYNTLKLLPAVTASPLVSDGLLLSGFLAGFIGLLAIYSRVAPDTPELARAGVVFATIGALAHTIDRVAALFVSLTSGTPFADVTTGLEPVYLVTFFCAIVAFILFSRAAFLAQGASRTVSLLLGVLPVMLFIYMFSATLVPLSPFVSVVWGTIAVSWLALGYRLRTADALTDHDGSTTDSSA